MRDAAFEHNRRMMDMAQLRYEGKQEGLAEGIEKGIERGIQQGIERGIEQGIGQGIEKQRLEIAREMLRNHCDDQLIQLCPKITALQLEQLKRQECPESAQAMTKSQFQSAEN